MGFWTRHGVHGAKVWVPPESSTKRPSGDLAEIQLESHALYDRFDGIGSDLIRAFSFRRRGPVGATASRVARGNGVPVLFREQRLPSGERSDVNHS